MIGNNTPWRRLLAASLLLGIAGCNSKPTASPGPEAKPAGPTSVKAIHPERKILMRIVEQPGSIQAQEETHLFARVPGYVGKVNGDIGQKIQGPRYDGSGKLIEAGQILAELSVPELVQEGEQKKALVRLALAEVEQSKRSLASAEAQIVAVESAVIETKAFLERWKSEMKRTEKLVASGAIDVQTRDEAENQFRAASARVLTAEAAVKKAQADRNRSEAEVTVMQARVDAAQSEAARVEALLAYAKIRAPYDGIVTSRRVNTGDFVQPASGKGDWLFTVARLDPVRVVVAVPESDAGLVREQSEMKLLVKAVQNAPFVGKVTRFSWSLEPGSRTLRTEMDLPNPDGKYRPGMYVYAQITAPSPENWALPAAAIAKQGENQVCFLMEDGKAVRTPVQIGRIDGDWIEILKYQRPTLPAAWSEFTGKERIAGKAAGLTDGQALQIESDPK